ncbi:TPA: inverse autotransporter beta domain-containing protein [Providencia rettgeri]|uniref:inverse autotransporter beta domain-containing protein n=1 Tax=Providencia TaxID=586 RepID=UPI001B98C30D|nr:MULTISPECIES: inverse autotransporter beta domain-containing protein [Providencia]EMB5787496.1 inverse autotransporter beta domain-containing protein [Providencia rettgeri]MDK7746070.1 inverse autotransporter beta domain-containing protein [Providencia rettgeri]MDK7758516.1 inverse autotransporter beta domain-containing protein [Providencia rettgeri]HBC7430232.1 inverse autotransporter beta domain-containing protein [Providencia rettgeri]
MLCSKKKFPAPLALLVATWSLTIMPTLSSDAKMLTPDELPLLGSPIPKLESNDGERNLAQYSKTAASWLAEQKNSHEISQMAQSYLSNQAANAAIEEITHWLSKAGNVKVSLNFDKQLSLKNSHFDWLIPWYQQTNMLLFTQHSIHNTDGRLQSNNGIGLRHFNEQSTVGVNAFFDHDLSHYHSRLGVGAEYWQDYLKLSANTYFPVSSWRSSSELTRAYDARPARGWDVQAQGWLPAYPQLGANLKFEQYVGHNVALMGKNKLQEDPTAATLGVNWTPFTLITLGAEHKISSGLQDTSAKVQFNWAFDKTFIEQIDPAKVGESRRVSGNRLDFVNRNNNIVLDYQKKIAIQLKLAAKIQGEAGQELPLVQSITTQYPLKKIVWNAPELLAAGGVISSSGQNATVKLPTYKTASTPSERERLNRYRLSGIAYDIHGNASSTTDTLIEVTSKNTATTSQPVIQSLNIVQTAALANGKAANMITAYITDALGNPIAGETVNFSATRGKIDAQGVTNQTGVIEMPLTSVHSGISRVTATINGQSETVTVYFISGTLKKIEILNTQSPHAGEETVMALRLTDVNGNPVSGADGIIMVNIGNKQVPVEIEESSVNLGEYSGLLAGQMSGDYTISASLHGKTSPKHRLTVNPPLTINAKNSDGSGPQGQLGVVENIEISASSTHNVTVGSDVLITVTLSDAFGNTLEGINPKNIDLGRYNTNILGWYEESDGDYSTYLTLLTPGDIDIIASINGHSSSKFTVPVTP